MSRPMWALTPLGVVAWVLSFFHAPEVLLFLLSAIGIIPLAALIGKATEEAAYHVGSATGGLLNATFGNVPELIIGIFALRAGLVTLTQASIVGSVIGNASLVLGMSLLYGGIVNGKMVFDRVEASHQAVLMVLTVASLALPSLFVVTEPRGNVEELSLFVAALLIISYIAYVVYSIGGYRGGRGTSADDTFMAEEAEAVEELIEEEGGPEWSLRTALIWLAAAMIAVSLASDVLVASIKPVEETLHISQFFVGVIIIPIVGNVAEHYSALTFAGKNKLDLTFGIAAGSSVQVALFVAPILVVLSLIWHPMTLVFNPIEITVLALVVAIFFFVAQDGESNWLEGLQLFMIYIMAAAVFFFIPGPIS